MTEFDADVPTRLTRKAIADSAEQLARRDDRLAEVLQRFGPPPLLRRPATFGTLVHIILEQQVSVESAKATFDRVCAAGGQPLSHEAILKIGETGLRPLGFSRQKAHYTFRLAAEINAGDFNVSSLRRKTDAEVRELILQRKGLGQWSADVFLMMALLRSDVLPVGDLALVKGLGELDGTEYSSADEIISRAEIWRPLRSVATRMVWQWYVHSRGRDIF